MSLSKFLIEKEIFKDDPGYPQVDLYAELPPANSNYDEIYAVAHDDAQHFAGLYRSNGSTWEYFTHIDGGSTPTPPQGVSFTRDGNGDISVITKSGGESFYITRSNRIIQSITNDIYTWTINRQNDIITSVTVTEN